MEKSIESLPRTKRGIIMNLQEYADTFTKDTELRNNILSKFYSLLGTSSSELINAWDKNPGAKNPYHNNLHQALVTIVAAFLSSYALQDKTIPALTWENINKTPSGSFDYDLVVACAFHDYNHSAGKQSDNRNILRAILGLTSFVEIGYITDIIQVTEYPFIRTPKTSNEKIIRDADLLCGLLMSPTMYYQEYVIGLREEIGVSQNRIISVEEVVEGLMHFTQNAEFYFVKGTVIETQYREFNKNFYSELKKQFEENKK